MVYEKVIIAYRTDHHEELSARGFLHGVEELLHRHPDDAGVLVGAVHGVGFTCKVNSNPIRLVFEVLRRAQGNVSSLTTARLTIGEYGRVEAGYCALDHWRCRLHVNVPEHNNEYI